LNYLRYIELSAENLQFFLWLQDYTKRFNELSDSEKVLSPEWTEQGLDPENQPRPKQISPATKEVFKGTDFGDEPKIGEADKCNTLFDPPSTPNDDAKHSFDSDYTSTAGRRVDHTQRAIGAFQNAGLQWKPCKSTDISLRLSGYKRSPTKVSVQPYRDEINRIISIYIADSGTRQLNLSSKERSALLHALQNTTHPSAFREVKTTVEWSLRCQAHPNFIRWAICNGNRPRITCARCLGIAGIALGLVAAILLTISSASRVWRIISAVPLFIGISTWIAAWKGMCVGK
jgi:hypothetical protein